MRLRSSRRVQRRLGFPRVSGDAPRESSNQAKWPWFSPRERGCARADAVLRRFRDVFPA